MRALLLAAALMLAVSACGKKAPLRAPDEPQEQSLIR
jgi:predicted small lipoprotein YifL